MRWYLALTCWAVATACGAGEPRGKVVMETWESAYLEGSRAGYVHTVTELLEEGGGKVLRTTESLKLKVKRFDGLLDLGMDTGMTETAAGKVVGTFMRQHLGKDKKLEITGTVVDNELRLVLDKTKQLKPAPWNDKVVSLFQQRTLLKDRKVKPGDRFSYQSFEPSINLIVTSNVTVKEHEVVELFGGQSKKRLLRVEVHVDKVQGVQLPALFLWLDDELLPMRKETMAPGLGKVVLYRSSREFALAPALPATLTDIGISQYIKLKQVIVRPHEATLAVYRITFKGEEDPATCFSRDARQEVTKVEGSTIELHVRSSGVGKERKGEAPGAEFIQSSYFIGCDDALVRKHARTAVGAEKDAWKKAQRIEKWVHENMRGTYHEALSPADHVARTLQGDCSEYAMLMAAMCRAEGVPSRTAIGLIYADTKSGPVFAFHMWTEVWARGQWVPLDATLGRGFVGATHLKITDASWHDERSLLPLLPVVRVLGRMSIEVVRAEGAKGFIGD